MIESSILIDSSQIAKIFDKKEKTVATKVQKSNLEKYETENVKLLKNYGLMHPEAIKPRPFYDLRQMLEGPAYYYFKKEDETDLIDVIVLLVNTVSGPITETSNINASHYQLKTCF